MSSQRFAHRMSDSDALMWNIEKDPILRSTIVAVGILDQHDRDRILILMRDRAVIDAAECPPALLDGIQLLLQSRDRRCVIARASDDLQNTPFSERLRRGKSAPRA